jgi:Domain of unknown function (DUF4397)
MKKLLAVAALAATIALGTPASTGAADKPVINLMHGIPGATVDVLVDGAVVIPGFAPGKMQDLSSFAGQTLKNVEVRAAGTTTVVIGPIPELAVPASGNWTVVAHLDASGKPTLTPFENDIKALAAGKGRLTVRHTAAAPAVDILLADGSRPFTNLVNPKSVAGDLPAGTIAGAKVAPTGGDPIADVPSVDLKAGTNLIVYAVGSLTDKTFTFYTQSISGLGGAPSAVNTGDAPIEQSTSWVAVMLIVAAGMMMLTGGTLVLARRTK